MGRRQAKQRFRGREAPNADPHFKADLVSYNSKGGSPSSAEVPFWLVGSNKAAKYGQLSARRALMKAAMAIKSGTTGYGCVPGCVANIIYPPSEQEKYLLESIARAGSVEVSATSVLAPVGAPDVPDDV